MEATLRPYDRGEEVTPFATLGLYHAYRALPSYAYPFVLSYLRCSEGRRGRSKNEFRKATQPNPSYCRKVHPSPHLFFRATKALIVCLIKETNLFTETHSLKL